MMFNSPLQYCEVIKEYVALDQTRCECAIEHECGFRLKCPLRILFQKGDVREVDVVQPSEASLEAKTVLCAACLKEIPVSELRSGEAVDYVVHFCGLECYEKWKAQARARGVSERGAGRLVSSHSTRQT